jgi:hypothetical protein
MPAMLVWEGEEDARETEEELFATRRLTFFMTSSQESFFDVMSDVRCPRKYDRHPRDNRLVLLNISPQQRSDAFRIWDIDLEYSSIARKREEEENPLNEPAEITWDTDEESEVIWEDGEGNPLNNTVGELLEGIEEVVSHWVIRIKKNVAKVPRYILDYDLAVNDGSVRISGLTFPKETLWLRRLHISEKQTKNDTDYYEFSFELHYKSATWARYFPNRGFHEMVDVPGTAGLLQEKQRILINGEPAAEPQWIDASGKRPTERIAELVSPNETRSHVVIRIKQTLDPEDFIFLRFLTKKRKNFGVLPLK